MIDKLFQICVQILLWLGNLTGTTYNEINIYVFFVIAEPLVFFIMLFMIIRYRRIIKKLRKQI